LPISGIPARRSGLEGLRREATHPHKTMTLETGYGRHAPIQQMIEQYSPGVCAKFFPNLVDEMKEKL
jgi:hypothetical protein